MTIKVCFLIMNISNGGGTERVTTMIADGLSKKGYDVSICSCQYGENTLFELSPDVNLFSIHGEQIQNPLFRKIYCFNRIRELLVKQKFDMMVAVDVALYAYLYPLQKVYNVKVIAWEHFNFFLSPNVFVKFARRLAAKHADCTIVLSKSDYNNYRNNIKHIHNLQYIYNPLCDTDTAKANISAKSVIAAGRLTKQKGFDLLIDSWSQVENSCPDWSLHIFGEGPLKESLEQQIQKLYLKHVYLEGFSNDIESEMAKSSIFVLSSRYEGFGLVLIEAQSKGLPCISFDCKEGPAEIIDNNVNGFLIEPYDIKDFANKMKLLMENIELRSEFASHATDKLYRFSLDKIIADWDMVIKQLCK